MKKYFLVIICFSFCSIVFSQVMPSVITKYIAEKKLVLLCYVDSVSKNTPANFTSRTGWQVDYYVSQNGVQRIVYILVHKDSTFHVITRNQNINHPENDSLTLVRESPQYLYFKNNNKTLADNLIVVSKWQEDAVIYFYNLVDKNFIDNIFVQINLKESKQTMKPVFIVSNLNSGKSKEVSFRNICSDAKNNWCLDEAIYDKGYLTIKATLFKKKNNLVVKESHTVGI